ncbi:serine/threonine-protein kinase [Actinoplanes subglobosus]|uniref:non-specific serine/threonine protein kinase n=1 Tax=Actinoplanes subglobosus TaxID=1547892 RepID=A0ABV8IKR8_9ACTN
MSVGSGRVVAGRYRLGRMLGRGGMGAVWQAEDTLLGREVALKEVWGPGRPADPQVRRTLREAQAAARLRHPSIVTVYDVVTDEGAPWIVMELVEGRSLAETIAEHGLLTEGRTAEIGLHVLDALRVAHREGIAHRDVKPANILLEEGRVVLTDFGIAAIDDATALTATGQMVGSPAYLAPERINGQPATAAADLWSLGVTLYTAVTGRSPFQREDTQATLAAILHHRPETPAHAGRLWPVIKGLLDKDPVRRLGADQARELLANVVRATGPSGADTPARRRPRWWPLRQTRPEDTPEGLPGTLVAPSPTLAAPTAHQQSADAPATPGAPDPDPVTVAAPAPDPDSVSTLASGAAPADVPPAATSPDSPAVTTAVAATEAAASATVSVPASVDPLSFASETATVVAAGSSDGAEAAATTEAVGAGEGPEAAAVPVATVDLGSAVDDTTGLVVAEAATLRGPGAAASRGRTVTPLPAHPGAPPVSRRVRTVRVWPVAAVVAGVLLAGGSLRLFWPEDGPGGGEPAAAAPSSGSAVPSAPVSASAVAQPVKPVNPNLDACLVGTWRSVSTQVINHFEGVDKMFTGKGGVVLRIREDGNATEDYSKSASLTATIKGNKYVETLRGLRKSKIQSRNGKLYGSGFSGGPTYRMTRNGKNQSIKVTNPTTSYSLTYICSDTGLTVYGDEDTSTDSYERVSRTP